MMKTKLLWLVSIVLMMGGTSFALTADPNVVNGNFEDPVLATASIDGVYDWWHGQSGSGVNTRKWGSAEFKGGSREGLNFAQMVNTNDSIIQPVALFQPNTPYDVSCKIEKRYDQLGPAGRIELWAGGTALPTNDPLLSGNQYGSANWPLTLTGATLVDSISFDFSWKGKWSYVWGGQQTFTLTTDSSYTTSDLLYLVFVKTPGGGQMAIDDVTMTISDQTVLTSPENGAIGVPLDTALEWVGPGTYDNEIFDVYIGTTEPNFTLAAPYGLETTVATGTSANTASPTLGYSTTYYWVADVHEPNLAGTGYIYHPATTFSSFTTIDEDIAPVVDITQNGGRIWNGGPAAQLDALVTDLEAIASAVWTVTGPAAYTGDPSLFLTDTTVDLNAPTAEFAVNTADPNAFGNYTITLTATDDAGGAGALVGSDTVWITVHETACDAAKANGVYILPADINTDCLVDMLDLARLAEKWLDDRRPITPILYLP